MTRTLSPSVWSPRDLWRLEHVEHFNERGEWTTPPRGDSRSSRREQVAHTRIDFVWRNEVGEGRAHRPSDQSELDCG